MIKCSVWEATHTCIYNIHVQVKISVYGHGDDVQSIAAVFDMPRRISAQKEQYGIRSFSLCFVPLLKPVKRELLELGFSRLYPLLAVLFVLTVYYDIVMLLSMYCVCVCVCVCICHLPTKVLF